MATKSLVTEMIDSGENLVSQLRQAGFEVAAAFWIKPSDEDKWFLYVASSVVDDEGLAAAYRRLFRILRQIPGSWVFESDVKLIGVENPVAKDVLDIHHRDPEPFPTWYGGRQLGNIIIDEAYLYPPTSAA